jgi:uncharacterized membrane protein YfcA
MEILVLLSIGLFTGIISGLFGLGGGFILIPLLILSGEPVKSAVALSLVFIIGVSISGLVEHIRRRNIDFALAFTDSLPGLVTAQFGAMLVTALPDGLMKILFAVLTVSVAGMYFLTSNRSASKTDAAQSPETHSRLVLHRTKKIEGVLYNYQVNLPKTGLIGALVGFTSGLFGVGGGFLKVPLYTMWLKIPLRIAIGTSLLSIILPALSASANLWLAGALDLSHLPWLLAGGLIGAQFGVRLMFGLREKHLRLSLAGLLVVVSLYMFSLGTGLLSLTSFVH